MAGAVRAVIGGYVEKFAKTFIFILEHRLLNENEYERVDY